MRTISRPLRLLLGVASVCGACSTARDAAAPAADDLLGRWATDQAALQPAGSHRYHLTFMADGRFVAEVRTYGVYAGQAAGDLSAVARTDGTFDVAGDRLTLAAASLTTWDSFYGAASGPNVQTPYPFGALYDGARFRVRGNELSLDYTTYPADAPQPARQTFRRER